MIKIFWCLMIMLSFALPLHARVTYQGEYNSNQNMQEYFSESYPNYDKSIIYIFFNNNQCYQCPETIAMIENIYSQNYTNKYNLFVINYQNDQEYNFIQTYNLNQPLEVVLVQVDDGQTLGYKKLENLQNNISDPETFKRDLRYQINSFLGTN